LSKLIAKCGMNCGTCPWGPYARENMSSEEFGQYRKDAKKILGYQPMQKPCPTCQTPNEMIPKGSKLPPRNCLVRKCVDRIDVENCAYCSKFQCEAVKDTAGSWNRKKFEEKHGGPISEEDYRKFIEPFEGLQRLKTIRASIRPEDIVHATKAPPLRAKITEFPEDLPFSKEETTALKEVHEFLATVKRSILGVTDTDTFAQQERLNNRTSHFLRFLWILGRFGEFREENGAYLVVDAKTYIANRGSEWTLASWPYVKDTVFNILSELGVHCERVALEGVKEKALTTGTGYLRSKGWVMKASFDNEICSIAAVKALQTFARKLDEKYGKRAFRHFADVDLRILSKD
jgi:hypothetical protein